MRSFHFLIVAVAILFWLQSASGRKVQREIGVMTKQQTAMLFRQEY
jgi:hypothetical protein